MLSPSAQRRIMRDDAQRRLDRDIAEHLALHGAVPASLTRQNGMPLDYLSNHSRLPVAHDASMYPRERAVGIATGTSDTSQGPTVRVIHADGTTEVRTVSSFRKDRVSSTRQRATATTTVKRTRALPMTAERAGLTNNIGQDYS